MFRFSLLAPLLFHSVAAQTYVLDAGFNDVEFMGNDTTTYNTSTDTLTVLIERGAYYENFNSVVTLWAIDRSTPLNDTVCGVGNSTVQADNVDLSSALTLIQNGTNSDLFSQDIFMNLTDMEDSNIFFNDTATDGEIEFCARVDYKMADGTSVGFAESLINFVVNMTAGFELTPVGMKREDPTTQDATADYTVGACICDDNYDCITNPLISQNSEMRLCLTSPSEGLKIGIIQDVFVMQDNTVKLSPIEDSLENAITGVEVYNEVNQVVITRAISDFFEDANPSDITFFGRVLLRYLSSGRRVLQENVFEDGTETNVGDAATGAFELSVGLKPVTDLEQSEDIATDKEDEEKKDDVVVEGQEKEDSGSSGESAGNSVPINLIVGVAGAVVCTLILVVGLRRSRDRSDPDVAVKYGEVDNSV